MISWDPKIICQEKYGPKFLPKLITANRADVRLLETLKNLPVWTDPRIWQVRLPDWDVDNPYGHGPRLLSAFHCEPNERF